MYKNIKMNGRTEGSVHSTVMCSQGVKYGYKFEGS
jgi:hypothetical protein